jgi:hypothetical protein
MTARGLLTDEHTGTGRASRAAADARSTGPIVARPDRRRRSAGGLRISRVSRVGVICRDRGDAAMLAPGSGAGFTPCGNPSGARRSLAKPDRSSSFKTTRVLALGIASRSPPRYLLCLPRLSLFEGALSSDCSGRRRAARCGSARHLMRCIPAGRQSDCRRNCGRFRTQEQWHPAPRPAGRRVGRIHGDGGEQPAAGTIRDSMGASLCVAGIIRKHLRRRVPRHVRAVGIAVRMRCGIW